MAEIAPTRPRGLLAGMLAALLALALAVDAIALSWGTIRPLTITRNAVDRGSVVTTTGNVLHAVFGEARGGVLAVRYRRSTDAGATWSASRVISSTGATFTYGATASARGDVIDAAWIEDDGVRPVLTYRRSTDAGVTWAAASDISSPTPEPGPRRTPSSAGASTTGGEPVAVVVGEDAPPTIESGPRAGADPRAGPGLAVLRVTRSTADTFPSPSYPRIVRDPSNRVIVTWTDDITGGLHVRRSTDGGVTWLADQTIDTTTNASVVAGRYDAFPDIAAGTGVIYLVYYRSSTSLRLRRSTDGGATWTSALTIASNGSSYTPDVAATGSGAVVGYAVWSSPYLYAVTRRTTDKGATWKSAVKLGSATGYPTFQPTVIRGGGRWQAIYERCLDAGCGSSATYYRSSTDGLTWTTAVRISSSVRPYEYPAGMTYSDRLGVAYFDAAPAVLDSDMYFRTGS